MTMSQTIYAETEDRHSGKKNACGPRASVSWSAVLAGAISIVTMIGLLSILGIAIGFSGLAMIEKSGASAAKIGMTAVIWMIAAQWAASTLGGYITGRVRHLWQGIHPDESYFRDTVHGFLAWCVAVLFIACLSTSISFQGMSPFRAQEQSHTGDTESAMSNSMTLTNYDIDRLLRPAKADATVADDATRTEISHIYAVDGLKDQMPDEDRTYVSQIVQSHAGVDEAEAGRRVTELWAVQKDHITQAKEEIAAAGKTGAKIALYSFLALLIGAFVATASAALGGAHRDEGWGCKK